MSIDTTFKPMTPTYAVDNTAAVQIKEATHAGVVTFRVRALVSSGYLAWGPSTVAAPTAPTIGSPKANVIGITFGAGVPATYIEVPANSFFIGNQAFASGGFEITGGQGGSGGG